MKIKIVATTALLFAATTWPLMAGKMATNIWKVAVGFYSDSSPAMSTNGMIYVATWNGVLWAINPTGSVRWRLRLGQEMKSSPVVGADQTIYIGCRDRKLYAVDAEGRKKWSFQTGAWVDTSAALGVDGTVHFGSWDKKFYALTPAGKQKWEFLTGGPVVSSAAIDVSGVIYFGSHDRKLYALNPDGTKRWEFATGGVILSSPAIGEDGTVYITSVDGMLYAVTADGTLRWKLFGGCIEQTSPVVGADGTIYFAGHTNICASTPDGRMKWQWPLGNQIPGQPSQASWAVLANGNVIVVPGDGMAVAMTPAPDWAWMFWLEGTSRSSPVVAPDGTIYFQTYGSLFAVQGGSPLANSSWPMFRADAQHTGRVRRER